MKRFVALPAVLVVWAVFATSLPAQPIDPEASTPSATLPHYAHVDTVRGRLAATGTGMAAENIVNPDRMRRASCIAAELDARRKLVELALGLGLDSVAVVQDFVPESDTVRSESAGVLGPIVVEEAAMIGDRTCRVTVSADVPQDMWYLLPETINPAKPAAEVRAPMANRTRSTD